MKPESTIDLSFVSSDEEHEFTMSIEDAAIGLGVSPQTVKRIASESELLEVSTDTETEEHITKAGVVEIGSHSSLDAARRFAEACKQFSPNW